MRQGHSHLFEVDLHGDTPKSWKIKTILQSFSHSSATRGEKQAEATGEHALVCLSDLRLREHLSMSLVCRCR